MNFVTYHSGKNIKTNKEENEFSESCETQTVVSDKFTRNLWENMCKLKHPEVRFLDLDNSGCMLIKPHTKVYKNPLLFHENIFRFNKNKYYHLFRHSMGYVSPVDFFRAYNQNNLKIEFSKYTSLFPTPKDLENFIIELNKFENCQNPESALIKFCLSDFKESERQEVIKRVHDIDMQCRKLFEHLSKKDYFEKHLHSSEALVSFNMDCNARFEKDEMHRHFSKELLESAAFVIDTISNRHIMPFKKIKGKTSLILGPKELSLLHQVLLSDYFNSTPITVPSVTITRNGDIQLNDFHKINGFFDFFKDFSDNPMLAVIPQLKVSGF